MGFVSRGRGLAPRVVIALAAAALVAAVVAPSEVRSIGRLTNDAIAVWQHRSMGGDWDVVYSCEGSDSFASLEWGALPGPQVSEVASLVGDDENPSVAMNPLGGAIVVWEHATGDLDLERDIWFASFDESEPTGWTAAAPLAPLSGNDSDPAIAFGADGKAIAVWVREDGGGTRIASATYDGGTWTLNGLVGTLGNGGAAIPEITFTNRASVVSSTTAQRAVAAWSDSDGFGGRRLYFSEWIGNAWIEVAPVTLIAAQDFDVPGDRESQIGLASDSSGNVKLVWSGDGAGSPGVVASTWDGATWAADTTVFGDPLLAIVRAHSASIASDPSDNLLAMYTLDGALEFSTDAGAFYTPEALAQDTSADDRRPVSAPVRDRFTAVFWGDGGATSPSEVYWTSYLPDTGEWTTASPIHDLPGLAGEDRYPDISSFLVTSGPTLLSVHPTHGPTAGGTGVFLGGYRFAGGGPVTVTFGGAPATNVMVIDDNTIVCETPAGTGLVDVVVTNDQSPSTLADAFSYDPQPIVNVVVPALGPYTGGTDVTILGSFFEARDEVVAVDFDGVPALNVVLVDDSTITCTTPPAAGTTLADVSVTNLDGTGTLVDGFRYIGPEILCRTGNVNAGVGPIADVLFINGSAGSNPDRIITVAVGQPVQMTMARPPAKPTGTSRYTLYIYPKKVPTPSTVTQQARSGHDLGEGCMPTPLSLGSPQPGIIFNNIGHNNLLGVPTRNSNPAPTTIVNLNNGINKVITLTAFGFILDPGSAATDPASITNTIILQVQ